MKTRAAGLEVSLAEGEGWLRTLTVSVPSDRVARVRTAEIGRLSRTLRLKGFRKGKIPTAVVEQRFGDELDGRVQQTLLDEAYREALADAALSPAGPGRITNIRYEPGEPFVFEAELEVMPTIELDRTGGFKVTRVVDPVTDEEVASILERIREENAEWRPVERAPAAGDRVSVRISPLPADAEEPTGRGTPYQLVLGTGKALDDVEEAIQTMSPGTTEIFAVDFPDEDGGDDAVLTRRLHIALDGVEEKELPELTDEFAAGIGDFEDRNALVAALREDLARHHEKEAEEKLRGELLSALIEAHPFVVPAALVDRYLEGMMRSREGLDAGELDRMREAVGPHAERQIREELLLEAVIDREGFRAGSDEVDVHIEKLAEGRDITPAKLRRELAQEGQLSQLEHNLAVEKAFAYLKGQSGVS
ncbi:MAG: trigger factor [Gemmatimonadota bacterium]